MLREVGIVVAVGGFQLFTAHAGDERFGPMTEQLDAFGVALLLLGPVTLPLRRRAPWFVVGVAVLAGIVYFSLGYPGAAIFATVVVALISLRRRRIAEQRVAREQVQAQRASEERVAIARDLHDVLAHSLSVVQVQAGVALHLMEQRPEQVREALAAIKTASDDGMRELRAAVAALRGDGAPDAPLGPAPGLADLDRLAAGAQASGLQVRVERALQGRPVPPEVELVAYRVVQEALTNTVRHARARSCVISVSADEGLVVTVDDDGSSAPTPAPGNGLRGMHERVSALGGQLDAGPRPGGGFRVRAVLPLGAA